jgi:UDP-glucose 4-epimerase
MANILVTGGAGYVGSVCTAELLRTGHSVTVVDDLSTGFPEAVPDGASFFEVDIGNADQMKLVLSSKFDVVFHFAARTAISESVYNPGEYFHCNVEAGIKMLEALRRASVNRFVFSSSAAVYGILTDVPIDEDSPKHPVNPYGETKLMFERILEWYARAYRWSVVAFRYFNAAGATLDRGERHDPETHVIPLLLEAAADDKKIFTIFGDDYDTPDGTCVRDYVHVLDIASAHVRALQRMDEPGMRVFNIGVGKSYSIKEICQAAKKLTRRPISIQVGERRAGDPPVLCASPQRILRELNWSTRHSSLEEIISSAWEWKQRQLHLLPASPRLK